MISSTATFSSVHAKVVRPVTGSDAEAQGPLFGLRQRNFDGSSPFVVELPDNSWFTPMHTRLERICKQMTGDARTEALQQLHIPTLMQNGMDSSLVPSFSTTSTRNITDPSPTPIRVGADSWANPDTDSVGAEDDEQPVNAPPFWLAQQSFQQRVQYQDAEPHNSASMRANHKRPKARRTPLPNKSTTTTPGSASQHPVMAGPCLSTLEVVQAQVQRGGVGVDVLEQTLGSSSNAVATLVGVGMLGAGITARDTTHRTNTGMGTGVGMGIGTGTGTDVNMGVGAVPEAPVWVIDTIDSFESSPQPAAQGLLNASNVSRTASVACVPGVSGGPGVSSAWRNDGYPDVPVTETGFPGPSDGAFGLGAAGGSKGVVTKGDRSRTNARKTSIKSGGSSRVAAASIECMLNPALAMVVQGLDLADGRAVADEDAYGCALVEVAQARAATQRGSADAAEAGEGDAATGLGHGGASALAARVAVHALSRMGAGVWAGTLPGTGAVVDVVGATRAVNTASQRKEQLGFSTVVSGASSAATSGGAAAAGEESVEESELDAEVARYAQLRAEAVRSRWAAPGGGHGAAATLPLEVEGSVGLPPSAASRSAGGKSRQPSEGKSKGTVAARLRAHGKMAAVSATDKLLLELEERGEALRRRRAKKASLDSAGGDSDAVDGPEDSAGHNAGASNAETSPSSTTATSVTLRDAEHPVQLPDASHTAAELTNEHPISPPLSSLSPLNASDGADADADADADAESLAWEAELRSIRNTARERENRDREASISELRAAVQEQNSWVEGLLRQVTGKGARVSLMAKENSPASSNTPVAVKEQVELYGDEEDKSASVDHMLVTYRDTVQSAAPAMVSATEAALTAAAALADTGLTRYRDSHQRLQAAGEEPGVAAAPTAAAPAPASKARGGRVSAVPQGPSAPSRVVRVDVEQLLRRAALLTAQVAAFQQGDMAQYHHLLKQLSSQGTPQDSVSNAQPTTQKRAVRGPNKTGADQSTVAGKKPHQPPTAPRKAPTLQRRAITTGSGDNSPAPRADAVGEADTLHLRLAMQRARVEEAQRMRTAAQLHAAAEAELAGQRATELTRLRTGTNTGDTNADAASGTTLGDECTFTREQISSTTSARPASAAIFAETGKTGGKASTSTVSAASAAPAEEVLARRRLAEEREKKRATEELLAQQQRVRAEAELLKKKEEEEQERLRKKQADLEWTRQVDARRRQREEREKARLQKEAEEKRRLDALIEEEERRKKEERDRRMQALLTIKKK